MNVTTGWLVKDPDERFPVEVDWSQRVPADDIIATSVWLDAAEDPHPLIVISPAPSIPEPRVTRAWIGGGTVDQMARVTNRITTSQGRILDYSLGVRVQEL